MRTRIVLLALAGIMLVGCVAEDPTTFIIVGNQLINRKVQCVIKTGGGALEMQPIGTMDLLQTNQYYMFPVVKNQLTNIGATVGVDPAKLVLESNNISITGATVDYHMDGLQGPWNAGEVLFAGTENETVVPDETKLPKNVWIATSGVVESDFQMPFKLEVVTPEVGQMLDQDKAFDHVYAAGILKVVVVLTGYLGDGTEIHSPEFHFPIKVCRGCLVGYDVEPELCVSDVYQAGYVPCFPGQDESTPCTLIDELLWDPDFDRIQRKVGMLVQCVNSLDEPVPEHCQALVNKVFSEDLVSTDEGVLTR